MSQVTIGMALLACLVKVAVNVVLIVVTIHAKKPGVIIGLIVPLWQEEPVGTADTLIEGWPG